MVALTARGSLLLAEMTRAGDLLTDEILTTAGVDLAEFRTGLRALIDHLGPAQAPER